MVKWADDKTIDECEDEMSRIADCVISQGDIDCILEMIPLRNKIEFINEWNKEE